jgi:hypothetical protein
MSGLPLQIMHMFENSKRETFGKKAKLSLVFKTVFDCRQKISISKELK